MSYDVDVVVVGAGLGGLVAARRLGATGASVAVLEARDRVGGRLLNAAIGDGAVVEVGGQWVGPGQQRVAGLISELGLETFPTFDRGRSVLELEGRRRHYSGTIPRVGPLVLADIALARFRLQRLARRLDPEAPGRMPGAEQHDGRTLQSWLQRGMRTGAARAMMRVAGRTVWGAEPEEMSLLHALFYVRAAGGLDPLLDVEGGAQESRIVGGSQLLAERIAADLGPSVVLGSPVGALRAEGEGVLVEAKERTLARRVIVAVPAHLRNRIDFGGSLPHGHRGLSETMRFGRLIKCVAVYEQPFWREQGLSGEALSDRGPATLTFDNSPPEGSPGVLLGFVGGRDAHRHARLGESDRREEVLGCFERLFGALAARPRLYLEQDWGAEPWSGGGPTFVMPPGAWTRFGDALRAPAGPIHWAGTETATRWAGFMDGAVQSGERAAAEVLSALG